MDIVKVFTEEPAGLEALARDDEPDAHRRGAALGSLDDLLAGAAFESDYARAYLAGTHLGPPPRIGLTAIAAPEAFVQPLLTWASGRPWTHLDAEGRVSGLVPAEAAARLRGPRATRALALGPADGDRLQTAAEGARRDALPALRSLLDGGAALLFPEPAHDGWDWSLFARRPLRDPLVRAFRDHPRAQVRRFVVPYQKARGEHRFYFEQWQLDALPEFVEEV